jgi:hypothetical protein
MFKEHNVMKNRTNIIITLVLSIIATSLAYFTYPVWFPVNIKSKRKQIPKEWLSIKKEMKREKIIKDLGYPNGMDMWRVKADEWILKDNLGWFTFGVVYDEKSAISTDTYILYNLGNRKIYSKPYNLE